MRNPREYWIRDLEQLLDETVVHDAVAQLMEKFEEAIAGLPENSRTLISRYFDGVSLEQLGQENSVSAEQMGEWIERAKRELAQLLRAKCSIPQ